MPRRDSASVELDGLREQIEDYRPSDRLWKSLSLSKKLRYLIEVALGIRDEKRAIRDFIRAIAYGESTERFSTIYLAEALEIEPDVINKLKGKSNGSDAKPTDKCNKT